jgi:hypothetical protein
VSHDIDLVIAPTRASLETFVRSLDPAAYYVSEEAERRARHLVTFYS